MRTAARTALLLVVVSSAYVPACVPAAQIEKGQQPTMTATAIDATDYIDMSLADCGIQKAIDAAAKKGGGIVQLPEGRFVMERYLYLRSGVTLRGRGKETVLAVGRTDVRRPVTADVPVGATEVPVAGDLAGLEAGMLVFLWPYSGADKDERVQYYRVSEVRGQTVVIDKPAEHALALSKQAEVSWGLHTYLTAPAAKGGTTVTVAHPKLLRPGDAIKLTGKGDMWGHHFNVIRSIDGHVLTLERSLTVSVDDEGLVQHGFAMITADGEKGIGATDLIIEGWTNAPAPRWVGLDFPLGGVHFVRCDDIELRNVEIRNWHMDGFSIQRGVGAVVDGCAAVRCRGRGFHPGTTFRDAEFTGLTAVGNAGDGFYYCWFNNNVNLRNSLIKDNAGHGVGSMGSPGEHNLTVEGNTIEGNGLAGIWIDGGGEASNSVIRNNVIRDNSKAVAGDWPGIAIYADGEAAGGYLIESNTIASTACQPTQMVGIEERNGDPVRTEITRNGEKMVVDRLADRNVIKGNAFCGHRQSDIVIVGPGTIAEQNGQAKVVRDAAR